MSSPAGFIFGALNSVTRHRFDARRYMPFVETLNEDHQKLLTGSSQYGGGRSARDLAEPREHTGWGLGVNAPPS